MRRAPAFTLLEVLIAAGIGVSLMAGLVLLLHDAFAASTTLAQHANAYVLAEDLSDRWDAEATSAFAIFIPPVDVLGASNADGHEVDFYTQDGRGTPFFWAYRFDSTKHTLQRYTYSTPGAGVTASGNPLASVSSFVATSVPVSAFTEPVFKGYAFTPVVERLGYPGVAGGNTVTELHLVTGDDGVTADLLPGIAPSGFTIVVGTFTPAPTALVVNPTTLTFTSPQAAPQTFSVSQVNYVGDFGVPSQCIVGPAQSVPAGTVAATVSGSTAGPSATMMVTPNASMTNPWPVTCTLAVSGGGGQTAAETVNVDPHPSGGGGSPQTFTLTATGQSSVGGICNPYTGTNTDGPYTPAQVPTYGSPDLYDTSLVDLAFPTTSAGDGQQGPLTTDAGSWDSMLSQVAAAPANTPVYVTIDWTLMPACGGGL